jgi:hypothetical protein
MSLCLGAKPGEGGELPGYKVTKERVHLVPEAEPRHSIFYQKKFPLLYALRLKRLAANAEVATVLGPIPASSDTVESERRQMKQC